MPSRLAVRLASILSPIRRICSALRADEVDVVLFEDLGEARVLGEEAVARMHRVGAGDLAGGEQRRNVEVAVARGGGPMHTLSSASRTCMASSSAVECTATVGMPSSLQARSTRSAISPRFAIRILSNIRLDDHQRLAELMGMAPPAKNTPQRFPPVPPMTVALISQPSSSFSDRFP